MKLNLDCVRDIMLFIEENQHIEDNKIKTISNHQINENLNKKFDYTDIFYSLKQCGYSGLIEFEELNNIEGSLLASLVQDITPKGHEFLANIHEDTVWNKTKKVGAKIGATSLNALVQISSNVISQIIKSEFGLN